MTSHCLGFWESIMLAATAQAECRWQLSEDMPDGFTWRGVTARDLFNSGANPGAP